MTLAREERMSNDAELIYTAEPNDIADIDVLFVGSAVGLASAIFLWELAARQEVPLRIAVVDAGPLDLLTHMAHASFPRYPFLKSSTERVGGRLLFWGVSAPRPGEKFVAAWPYQSDDLSQRFDVVERMMGVADPTPMAGKLIEAATMKRLQERFPEARIRSAPLAINRDGRRWCPVDWIPRLDRRGFKVVSRFRCTRLLRTADRITEVVGIWHDGREYRIRPRVVVLGIGAEASPSLVQQVAKRPMQLDAADHIRVDLHGTVAAGSFGPETIDDLGIAVLLFEFESELGAPCHLEVKVAPKGLWARGYMQSHDNLSGTHDDKTIYVQVQAVAAMHDRLPRVDLLNLGEVVFPPVMSARDAAWHGEIVENMNAVATAIGLGEPTFSLRPLLTNHHCYGAFRVGKTVTADYRFHETENLFILPPAAYVDADDDANPTLKSVVLSQYAMEAVLRLLSGNGTAC